ncbi:MAG: hypothetical protein IPI55_16050 [Flavobacteriales bacterium]|nr:hypothetical protein [Flavobacteriales bacterium]
MGAASQWLASPKVPDGGALLGGDHAPVPGEGHPFIMRTDATGTPLWALPGGYSARRPSRGISSRPCCSANTFLLTGVSGIWTGIRVAVDANGSVLFADISTDLGYTEVLSAANGDVLTGVIAPSPFGSGSAQGVLRTGADRPLGIVFRFRGPRAYADGFHGGYTACDHRAQLLLAGCHQPLHASDTRAHHQRCVPAHAGGLHQQYQRRPRVAGARAAPLHRGSTGPAASPGASVGPRFYAVSLANAQRYEMQLDGLPTGIYHLRILSDAGWSGHAMVKE